jgi:hypothetical protein
VKLPLIPVLKHVTWLTAGLLVVGLVLTSQATDRPPAMSSAPSSDSSALAATSPLSGFSTMFGEITSPIGGNAFWPSLAQFNRWMGRKVDVIGDYMDVGDTWASIDGEGPSHLRADASQIVKNPGTLLELAVPMLPAARCPQDPWKSAANAAIDTSCLREGAAGDFDQYFKILARKLVTLGLGHTIIRLGWESNGDWYPWSEYLDENAFIGYWQQIVTTMRSVTGSHFLFDWNGATGTLGNGKYAITAYPGDAYVDFLGADFYDQGKTLSVMFTGDHQLDWLASFALAHNKLISIGEWGLQAPAGSSFAPHDLSGTPGGDDPAWVQDMYNFSQNPANRLGLVVDFNQGGSPVLCDIGSGTNPCADMFPNAIATLKATFGQMPPGRLPSGW